MMRAVWLVLARRGRRHRHLAILITEESVPEYTRRGLSI